MRKFLCMMMVLCLVAVGIPAAAEEMAAGPLSKIVDAAERLLFEETNVTLEGDMSLDVADQMVSEADGVILQDEDDSYLQFGVLHATDEEEGYAVLGYGNDAYFSYYYPDVSGFGYERSFPSSTILRSRTDKKQIMALVRIAAERMDEVLADRIEVKELEDGSTRIRVEAGKEDFLETVNLTVNLVWRYALKSYPELEYVTKSGDDVRKEMMKPENEKSGAGETRLKLVSAELVLDAEGRLSRIEGYMELQLTNGKEGEVYYTLTASDYGTTNVRETEWVTEKMQTAVEQGEQERIERESGGWVDSGEGGNG